MPIPSGDDLYVLNTGGATGMPKGVLWRQHDNFLSSMGRRPWALIPLGYLGGEKIFVEEVYLARRRRPPGVSTTWWSWTGHPSAGAARSWRSCNSTDEELVEVCQKSIARYKIPKAFIRTPKVVRSPTGKADYRWAKELA
ncbi:MAG: 3-oxocholest-4-en-26-oate---CoA ligase, partial [Mycobacterium sp.]|nr:3-oxocholest-4-en-26-oate---CoA ligase [Mycobacterium sp.]